ncbi:unnamed protein product, partial [Prorocentrum cordatum]
MGLCDGVKDDIEFSDDFTVVGNPEADGDLDAGSGAALADPKSALSSEAMKFCKLGKGSSEGQVDGQTGDTQPPEFLNGFHMKHHASMLDGALLAVATTMGIAEPATLMPNQVRTILAPLLEKPAGGWRPK